MSVLFLVGSEEELSSGVEWCAFMCRVQSGSVHVAVPGPDRKALAEIARRRVSEKIGADVNDVQVVVLEAGPRAVRRYARAASCRALLMVYRTDGAKFQRQVFEESRIPSLWVRPGGSSPIAAEHAWSLFRRPSGIASISCEKLLGFAPSATLGEELDLEANDLADRARSLMETELANQPGAVVFCDVEHTVPGNRIYEAAISLLQQPLNRSLALTHPGDTMLEAAAATIRHWAESVAPPMEREERIELSRDLQSGSQPNLEYVGLISASSMLAAFGLLQDSASVVIGAMLIAPLMTPILGAGLALTQSNRPLFRSAIWTITLGFACALTASVLFGWLYWCFHAPIVSDEMRARCRPSPLDFCVGMVGGIAASYARTRSHLSSALAGAAIAAALVPPIATAGLQLAFWEWGDPEDGMPVVGPLLLVSVNVLMIMIGSSFVLWARGMRSDRSLSISDRWVLPVFALLTMLVLLFLIWTLHPFPPV